MVAKYGGKRRAVRDRGSHVSSQTNNGLSLLLDVINSITHCSVNAATAQSRPLILPMREVGASVICGHGGLPSAFYVKRIREAEGPCSTEVSKALRITLNLSESRTLWYVVVSNVNRNAML